MASKLTLANANSKTDTAMTPATRNNDWASHFLEESLVELHAITWQTQKHNPRTQPIWDQLAVSRIDPQGIWIWYTQKQTHLHGGLNSPSAWPDFATAKHQNLALSIDQFAKSNVQLLLKPDENGDSGRFHRSSASNMASREIPKTIHGAFNGRIN